MTEVISYNERRKMEETVEAEMLKLGHALPTVRKAGQEFTNWSRPDKHAEKQRNHMIPCRNCRKAGVVQLDGTIRGDALKNSCPVS